MSKKSLCIISPQTLTAGEQAHLKFTYITDTPIPKDSIITFTFQPGNIETKCWQKPNEFNTQKLNNVIFASQEKVIYQNRRTALKITE